MTTEMGENTSTTEHNAPAPMAVAAVSKASRPRPRTADSRIAAAHLAIGGALSDPTLWELLAPHGYGYERIAGEGNQLLLDLLRCQTEQSVAEGELYNAKDERDRVYRLAHKQYARDVTLARTVLCDERGAMQKLDLHTRRKTTQAGWLVQARQFYSVALADATIQLKLAEAALTREKLEAGRSFVEAVNDRTLVHAAARGAAYEATLHRVEAMRRLNAWMAEFRATARFVLRGRPQLLGKLGF